MPSPYRRVDSDLATNNADIEQNRLYLKPTTASGTTDIDVSASDYTGYITLLTITTAAGYPLQDLVIDLDLNKATTGYHAVATADDTLDLAVTYAIDGTNARGIQNATQIVAAASPTAANSGVRLKIGMVPADVDVVLLCKLSAERGDTEIPYQVHYLGETATVTAVAAG